ncbi:uncharacterized protein LOC117064710 isoform X2 [Trachypithecus francoisi]|uniref:uncharacterized protein LOC117064710 isoform X2 n=1 Tax=Trachypithecus francoisi TaxID=54180 RepID=UPI00141B2A70|nr:uncharacterized protein LOC117064710 isoform X2 [Trachypithecus francoisi]
MVAASRTGDMSPQCGPPLAILRGWPWPWVWHSQGPVCSNGGHNDGNLQCGRAGAQAFPGSSPLSASYVPQGPPNASGTLRAGWEDQCRPLGCGQPPSGTSMCPSLCPRSACHVCSATWHRGALACPASQPAVTLPHAGMRWDGLWAAPCTAALALSCTIGCPAQSPANPGQAGEGHSSGHESPPCTLQDRFTSAHTDLPVDGLTLVLWVPPVPRTPRTSEGFLQSTLLIL